jgi:hypothetical protein
MVAIYMITFHVGEIALLQNLSDFSGLNGQEVEIIGEEKKQFSTNPMTGVINRAIPLYRIRLPFDVIAGSTNGEYLIPSKFLRKKKPPREPLGSWDNVPFFNPMKEKI